MRTERTLKLLAQRAKRSRAARKDLQDALLKSFPKTYARFIRDADQRARKTKKRQCVVFEPYYLSARWLRPDQLRGNERRTRYHRWPVSILFAVGNCNEIDAADYAVIYETPAVARPLRKQTHLVRKPTTKRVRRTVKLSTPAAQEWWHHVPDRSGLYDYVVLIRGPNDPERKPRPKKGEPRQEAAPHLRIAKTNAATWAKIIAKHMNDGVVRTFNRIAVELVEKTADVVGGTSFEDGLWLLVKQGFLEYTPEAPIYFRKRKRTRL